MTFNKKYYLEELGDIDRDVSEYWPTLTDADFVEVVITPFKEVESVIASLDDIEFYLGDDADIQVDIMGVDEALEGLIILREFYPKETTLIIATDHDILYTVDTSSLLRAKITIEALKRLAKLNWMLIDESLCIYT